MKSFDVVVIGGGAIGSASLFHLVKSGVKNCLLIERANSPGRGASGSWGSLIRAMHLSPITTSKASLSLPFFHNFLEIVGEGCGYNRCGSLYFLKQDQQASIRAQLEILTASGVVHHVLDAASGRREFPHYNWFEDDIAIFEENAGTACPYLTTEALIRNACLHGATALFDDAVIEILHNNDTIHGVKTVRGLEISCGHVVIANGRWAKELTTPLGLNLGTFEKTIQINRFCRNHFKACLPLFIDRNLAAFGHFFADGSFAGGTLLPDNDEEHRLSTARLSIGHANAAKMKISKRLNWLKNSSLEGGIRATESYSSDGQGIIRNDFGYGNLVISTGFSCTGFTLAPISGKDVAHMITG